MVLFWQIMYVLLTLMCVAVLPFAIFYYEVRGIIQQNACVDEGSAPVHVCSPSLSGCPMYPLVTYYYLAWSIVLSTTCILPPPSPTQRTCHTNRATTA